MGFFTTSSISLIVHPLCVQPEIVDPASAGRWVCLQNLNTTQGISLLSLIHDRLSLFII